MPRRGSAPTWACISEMSGDTTSVNPAGMRAGGWKQSDLPAPVGSTASTLRPATSAYKTLQKPLDRFVEQYLRGMNAPGMTLALADRDGVQRVVTYGFSDTETHTRVKPDELFQIGSISKSFVSLCLLQLRDEGKLDL